MAQPRNDPERTRQDAESFADAVVHDLRTPLATVSGEVELALARERSPAEYREALARIGDQVTRLIEWTDDLALLVAPESPLAQSNQCADLAVVLASIADRVRTMDMKGVIVEGGRPGATVVGSQARLTRALSLLLDHAHRWRGDGGRVRLRAAAAPPVVGPSESVTLVLEVAPPRFPGKTWHHLDRAADSAESARVPGLLGLRTAARVVESGGGSLQVEYSEAADAVRIRLAPAHREGTP